MAEALPHGAGANPGRVLEAGVWFLLATLLVINLPAFVCMGLDPDVLQWDQNTRTVLEGRILYRDCADNNLPGMLVPLAIVHTLFGWRSEVLRTVDLLVVITIAWQLTRCLPPAATRVQRLVLVGTLLVFYLSISEWCHCQRDVWMLVPALAALACRTRQTARLAELAGSGRVILAAAFAEGLLWASAFWIKPFVAVPALVCWLLCARQTWASHRVRVGLDGGGVLAGGLAAGAAGILWLRASGAWPAFAEILFVWNQEYILQDTTEGHYGLFLAGLVYRFFPWILVHLLAVPLALRTIGRAGSDPARILLSGFYLGWLIQSFCLQHLFDYVNTPGVLLGLTLVASWSVDGKPLTRRLLLMVLFACLVTRFPALCVHRLAVWDECRRHGSTPALRDRLTLLTKANWSDLERVKDYLRDQDIQDGELTCLHMPTIALYGDLGVKSATRFQFVQNFVVSLPRQRQTVYDELAASPQRFLVCDLQGYGMDHFRAALDEGRWSGQERVVFRSGRYIVLRLSGAETPGWLEDWGR